MRVSSLRRLLAASLCAGAAIAPAAVAQEAPQEPAPVEAAPQQPTEAGQETHALPRAAVERGVLEPPAPATMKLRLRDVRKGAVDVGERFRVLGKLYPYVPGQRVTVLLKRGKRTVQRASVPVRPVRGGEGGWFGLTSKRIIKPARYRFQAKKFRTEDQAGAYAATRRVGVRYPDLDPGDRSDDVRLLNKLLDRQAYYTSGGRRYGSATGRAVLAFRKVNRMARTMNATKGIFRKLAAGRGGFKLKWPGGGKHVEADLSRQVMVLAKGGKARHIFHISSGAPATPTIQGKHVFTRKQPGTNSVGMVNSVYFGPTNRGYATHGYHSVPTYPASHGCLRNPIPNSLFIYRWIDIGDPIYVYP